MYVIFAVFLAKLRLLTLDRTKPGLRVLSRKRDKPLRTYGKRSTATPEPRGEPPLKRTRVTGGHGSSASPKTEAASTKDTPIESPSNDDGAEVAEVVPGAPTEENASAPAKQSILNYFKPVAPVLTEASASRTNIVASIEPPSPEKPGSREQRRPKRRRLLRIRSEQSTTTDESGDDENEGEQGENTTAEGDEKVRGSNRTTSRARKPGPKRAKPKHKSLSAVQTTLNISNQAAFSECKVCDTVWNPLYPDDVKYHTKRHATHLRSKKRELENEL